LGSFIYFILVRLIGVLTGRGSESQLRLENAVLRHQVRVLRRSVHRPELKDRDRALLAAASRALSRERWVSFMVTPQTLLRWHRELVRRKWTYRRATFFVPGRVAERYPHRVEEIVAAGHELAHHGYTHTSPTMLSPPDEEAEIVRGLEALRAFAPIEGYRSPSQDFSTSTRPLLEAHGFRYSSNFMDDVKPYRHAGCCSSRSRSSGRSTTRPISGSTARRG
jgi:Polysaccharide deacetylase